MWLVVPKSMIISQPFIWNEESMYFCWLAMIYSVGAKVPSFAIWQNEHFQLLEFTILNFVCADHFHHLCSMYGLLVTSLILMFGTLVINIVSGLLEDHRDMHLLSLMIGGMHLMQFRPWMVSMHYCFINLSLLISVFAVHAEHLSLCLFFYCII